MDNLAEVARKSHVKVTRSLFRMGVVCGHRTQQSVAAAVNKQGRTDARANRTSWKLRFTFGLAWSRLIICRQPLTLFSTQTSSRDTSTKRDSSHKYLLNSPRPSTERTQLLTQHSQPHHQHNVGLGDHHQDWQQGPWTRHRPTRDHHQGQERSQRRPAQRRRPSHRVEVLNR